MGVVYKARQVSLNRTVALKMILAGQLAGETEVRRFHAEAQAAAVLDHPGIVPVFEVGQHDGHHFLAMALVDGPSLRARLQAGPLPKHEAAALVRQVAEAMAVAHHHGIVDRDRLGLLSAPRRLGSAGVDDRYSNLLRGTALPHAAGARRLPRAHACRRSRRGSCDLGCVEIACYSGLGEPPSNLVDADMDDL